MTKTNNIIPDDLVKKESSEDRNRVVQRPEFEKLEERVKTLEEALFVKKTMESTESR